MKRHPGVAFPPRYGLIATGPLVTVRITPLEARANEWRLAGEEPPFIDVMMMVDTGAERTVIERSVAQRLGIGPIQFVEMVGVSQQPEECPVYPVRIGVAFQDEGGHVRVWFDTQAVGMSSPRHEAPYVGLIGRDFLSNMDFHYNGRQGTYELAVDMELLLGGQTAPAASAEIAEDEAQKKARQAKAERNAKKRARKKNR